MPESNPHETPPADEQPAVQPPEAGSEIEESQITETVLPYAAELRDRLSRLNVNEIKTMILLSEGLSQGQIAERLHLSANSVVTYKSNVLTALGTDLNLLPRVVEQAIELGVLDKEQAMAAATRHPGKIGRMASQPSPSDEETDHEAEAPKEAWEGRFSAEVHSTLNRLEIAGFKDNPDLLIPIKPGPILDELIEGKVIPETTDNAAPLLDFYATMIALLLGQKIPRQFLTHPKTTVKAHKIVRKLVDQRTREIKGRKFYKPPR